MSRKILIKQNVDVKENFTNIIIIVNSWVRTTIFGFLQLVHFFRVGNQPSLWCVLCFIFKIYDKISTATTDDFLMLLIFLHIFINFSLKILYGFKWVIKNKQILFNKLSILNILYNQIRALMPVCTMLG
jgi:hypothetical protein